MKCLFPLFVALVALVSSSTLRAQQPPDCYQCPSCTIAAGPTAAFFNFTGVTCGIGLQNWLTPLATDRYIRFTIPLGQINTIYTFSVCNSGSPANTVMYLTDASGGAIIACDDDGCGNVNGFSTITARLQNATYRLYLFQDGCNVARTDPIQVQIACEQPPT